MKPISTYIRRATFFVLGALVILGCGLFNNPAGQRAEDNQPITQGADLGQVVTAEGIGAGNAPVGVTDEFNASQDYIYVVAEARRIEQGTSMFARWMRDGQPFEDSSEVVADQDYQDTYVEFHLENLQASMEPGDYSVQLFVNGNPVQEVDFTVN
jgi:hypothetical protein